MKNLWLLVLLAIDSVQAADARLDKWIRSTLPPGARAVGPEVHSVISNERFVIVESAGLSMQSFGALETRPYDGASGVRRFTYRIPRQPKPAVTHTPLPLGVIGTFINGVPIYNLAGVLSYRDQNLWHVDTVAKHPGPTPALLRILLEQKQAHSPLIGFALDGHPIYGPYGWDDRQEVRRFQSSYRPRTESTRRRLPGREDLTPAQEGPSIAAEFPSGTFLEDYEYVKGLGDLDEHNGCFAKTPEFPEGTYAYFLSTREDGTMAYPYLIGPSFRGAFDHPDQKDWKLLGTSEGLRLSTKTAAWRAGERVAFAVTSPFTILERVHEKEMHVLVISDDLAEFSHIHPDPVTRQLFALSHVFPQAGSYWIFVDHTPPGQTQTIARFRVTVEGPPHAPSALRETGGREVTVAGIRATLSTQGPLQAGYDISFRFTLADSSSGNAISDLEPYLGAWGHILLVRKEGDEVIHAHPLEANPTVAAQAGPWVHSHAMPGPNPTEIDTVTGFRNAGVYKVWLQVQRHRAVLTFPFVLRIEAQRPSPSTTRQEIPNAQIVSVSAKGYEPARIVVDSNNPIRLSFRRLDAQNCAGRVVFPDLGIDRELPPGKSVPIEIPAQEKARTLAFSCGMGMYRGSLIVR